MRHWLWLGAVAAAIAAASHAQVQRQLPAAGKIGLTGSPHPFPLVQIDDRVLRLAPGGLIFDQDNRTILHQSLPPAAHVLYLQDANGNIARIVVLRPEELAALQRADVR
jgi:hypothetical protein